MYTFKAKHGSRVQNILLYKDMPMSEFKNSLHALQYTSDLPEGIILGFKDNQGQFIPPLLICQKPECFQNESYEVIIRPSDLNAGNIHRFPSSTTNGLQNASDTDDRQTPVNNAPTQMYQQQLGPSNHGLQSLSTVVTGVTPNTQSGYGSSRRIIEDQQLQTSSFSQRMADSALKHNPQTSTRNMGHQLSPQGTLGGYPTGYSQPSMYINNENQRYIQSAHSHQDQGSPLLTSQPLSDEDNELIQLVLMLPSDVLEDNMKSKVIHLLRQKDKGIRGALISYQDDNDLIALRNRIIHKVLSPSGSREDRHGVATSSSATTAGFQQYPSTAVGRERRPKNYQDQYMPIIIDLEQKGLLEEHTASVIKTLVLEENFDVQQVINTYINRVITDVELAYKLEPLSQALGAYLERPQSPLPKRKQDLMNQVNMLARFHFRDPDDVQLLQKLIQDENELILAVFDVYESDNNHENLIDSLQRILEKSKAMGIHKQSITATSFFNNHDPYWHQNQGSFQERVSSNNLIGSRPPYVIQQMTNQMRATTPTANQRSHRNRVGGGQQQDQQRRFHPHQQYLLDRPPTMAGQRFGVGQGQQRVGTSYDNVGDMEYEQFKPETTVHDVVVIPGYFSSGEEDHVAHQINSAGQQFRQRQISKPSQSQFSKYSLLQQYPGEAGPGLQNSPTRQFSSHNQSQMSRAAYKQSHQLSSTKYGGGVGAKSGQVMSSHTGGGPGGYQYSHMHHSIEEVDSPVAQMMDEDLGANILVSDGFKMHDYHRGVTSQHIGGRQTFSNHHRSQSGDYYKPRYNPHQHPPSYYNMYKPLLGGEKARSGAASMVRQPNVKRLDASDIEQDSIYYRRKQKQNNLRTYEAHHDRYHFGVDPSGNNYPLNTDNFSMSNRFSCAPGVGSSIHKIHGQSDQSKKLKDKSKKDRKKDKKGNKKSQKRQIYPSSKHQSKKDRKKKKKKRSSSSDTDSSSDSSKSSSSSSSSSSSTSSSASSSSSSKSSSSSCSAKSSVSSADKKGKKNKKHGGKVDKKSKKIKASKSKKKSKDKIKSKEPKKDKKKDKSSKSKLIDSKDKLDEDEKKKSKKNKQKKGKEKEKEKDKDKKKGKDKDKGKKSGKESSAAVSEDDDLNDRLQKTSTRSNRKLFDDPQKQAKDKNQRSFLFQDTTTRLSTMEIRQIMEDENLDGVMREDAYIIFLNSVKKGLPDDLMNVFKTFKHNGGSDILLSNVMSASEEMLQSFKEENFSNNEIGILYKLRQQRSSPYKDAFQSFSRKNDQNSLIEKLKEIIEEELALEAGDSNSQTSNRFLARQRTDQEKVFEIYNMAFQQDFSNNRYGPILKNAFEEQKDPQLLYILQNYMHHNDYLRLKNELTDYASQRAPPSANVDAQPIKQFSTLYEAISHFSENANFEDEEITILTQLAEAGTDKHLQSIWNAYQVISIEEDLKHSLKVLAGLRLGQSRKPARAAPAAAALAQQQQKMPQQQLIQPLPMHQPQPPQYQQNNNASSGFGSGGIGGLIKLNAMPAQGESHEEESQPHLQQQIRQNIKTPSDIADPFEISNNAGEMLDNEDDKMDDLDEYQPNDEDVNEEVDQAAQRLEQICRYSHKILKKYVVNGMITLQDGPQLHNLVDQRDYRIICILEVYSQNKNEDDFLENLGLLTQVIKDQGEEQPQDDQISFSDNDDNSVANEEVEIPDQETVQNDSFTMKIEEAVSQDLIDTACANWSIEAKKNENRRVILTYNAFKKVQDLNDFANSLTRLHKTAKK